MKSFKKLLPEIRKDNNDIPLVKSLSLPMLRWYFIVLATLFFSFLGYFKDIFVAIYNLFFVFVETFAKALNPNNDILVDKLPVDNIFTLANLSDLSSSFYSSLLKGLFISDLHLSYTLFVMALILTCFLCLSLTTSAIDAYREIKARGGKSAAEYITLFAKKYFGKDIYSLSEEENREVDSFGLYGCIEWLEDHGYLKEDESSS